ncbi:Glycosyltransferase involved in cell wall bisynthesis [Thiothrix caldifontis]|uniref:Glycosyltransferase involved in cell wall bisynthesis n=1 Tax=Thiothrix caldifontis TaxID=525918 RepID=A0A1H3VHK1_9GAMM|nr:glycosyltransferase [Thiothrix caldifontis]SDZ74236.1 Glycosyltransferase involved in cell wall bisynthesis [Thiothrix caldifontis]
MNQAHATIKVSVILPVYNHARWVQQAIASVLAQSFTSFELIIIDDASIDTSWQVIQSVCAINPAARIRCLRHRTNQGAPATINEGLQLAYGEYLSILNSDDVWEAGRLQRLVRLADSQGVDFISTDVAVLDADSNPKEQAEPHWVAWFEGLKQDYAVHADTKATLLRGNFLITTSNFFFHRRVYEQVGQFAELRYVHDYEYALRVVAAGLHVQFLSGEKLLGYRLHDTNTIREKPLAAIEENMQLLLRWLPLLSAPLAGLSAQLQDLYRYTCEEWLTLVHQRLLAREQELLPLIRDRDAWITERDQLIRDLQQHVAEQRQWLADRDGWIRERDAWIVQRDGWLVERDTLIQQQVAALAARDQWVADRDGWIRERDVLIQQLQQQQHVLLHSRAFRLGQALLNPFRRCKQWLRGGELCLKS